MTNDKKEMDQVIASLKTTTKAAKLRHRDIDFLTEVLACIAWTTKG